MIGHRDTKQLVRPFSRSRPAENPPTNLAAASRPSHDSEMAKVSGHTPRYCIATAPTSEARRNLGSYARRSGIRLSPKLVELQTRRRAFVYALRRTAENCSSLPIRSNMGGGSWHK